MCDRSKKPRLIAAGVAAVAMLVLLAGCGTQRTHSGGTPDIYIANAGEGQIQRCPARLGAAAVTESDANAQALSSEGLPRSMAPLMRQLLLHTRCFTVVERGAGFAALEHEMRIREQQGQQRSAAFASVTPADYVIRGEIVFAEKTGGRKSGIGGLFGGVLGGLGTERDEREALVVMTAVDVRTSEILAGSFGRGAVESSGLSSLILGGGLLALQGGWNDTPQAKPVAAALVDAWNRLLPRLLEAERLRQPAAPREGRPGERPDEPQGAPPAQPTGEAGVTPA